MDEVTASRAGETGSRVTGAVRSLRHRPNLVRSISVAVFFVCWEVFGRDMDPLFMTYPSAIAGAAWELTASGVLAEAMMESLIPFVVGLAISIVGGILIGVLIGQFWFLEYTLDPFINALYAIPRIALVPLVMLWAGLETTGKIAILVSIAIFPVIINTYAGIKDVRGGLLEIGRAYCATDLQLFTKIIFPASIPYIMAGIRLCVGLAIIGIIVGEFFTAISGLGGLIIHYSNAFATAKVFVPIILIGVVGVALTQAVMATEKWLSKWRFLERERNE